MNGWHRLVLAGLLVSALGCSSACRHGRVPVGGVIDTGKASWYGPGFHGKRTANGERYDMDDLTAAHRTLPFGTRVKVTRRDTGQSVVVRINDRGPFVRGRIIDLSRGAARRIDLDRDGVTRVTLRIVSWNEQAGPAIYAVQVGAFGDSANAERLKDQLSIGWDDVHVERFLEFHRVRVGRFASLDAARDAADRLRDELGVDPFVVREN